MHPWFSLFENMLGIGNWFFRYIEANPKAFITSSESSINFPPSIYYWNRSSDEKYYQCRSNDIESYDPSFVVVIVLNRIEWRCLAQVGMYKLLFMFFIRVNWAKTVCGIWSIILTSDGLPIPNAVSLGSMEVSI
jgi:hypothetical protein